MQISQGKGIIFSPQVTPPPPPTPFTALARSSSRLSDLPDPDTEELLEPRRSESARSAASLVSGASSASSGVTRTKVSREDKENDRQRKQAERQQKKQLKETEKKSSKAVKEAEKLVAKQTDKTEVNKYLSVVVDPALVSTPPGSEILNLLQNPASGKPEHVFQFSVETLPAPCCLVWKRKVISYSTENGDVDIQEFTQEEGRALILMSAESLIEKIADKSLETWVSDSKRKLTGKHLTLMVYNYNDYFKQVQFQRSEKANIS